MMTAPTNEDLLEIVTLENDAVATRKAGRFDAAVALASLARALRSGQITRRQLHTSPARCRLFGGREAGL